MCWVIIPVCLCAAFAMWTYSPLACTTRTVNGAGSGARTQVRERSAVNSLGCHIITMCAPIMWDHVKPDGNVSVACTCLILQQEAWSRFPLASWHFWNVFPACLLLRDSHKELTDCSNIWKRNFCCSNSERNLTLTESSEDTIGRSCKAKAGFY